MFPMQRTKNRKLSSSMNNPLINDSVLMMTDMEKCLIYFIKAWTYWQRLYVLLEIKLKPIHRFHQPWLEICQWWLWTLSSLSKNAICDYRSSSSLSETNLAVVHRLVSWIVLGIERFLVNLTIGKENTEETSTSNKEVDDDEMDERNETPDDVILGWIGSRSRKAIAR